MTFYEFESDICEDEKQPVFLSINTMNDPTSINNIHWHDVIELLYTTQGNATVLSNSQTIQLLTNELAVIGSNQLHTLYSEESCKYMCMQIQPKMLSSFGLPMLEIAPHINDPVIKEIISKILLANIKNEPFSVEEIKALVIEMFIYMYRNYAITIKDGESDFDKKHFDLVKEIIRYVRLHFAEELTIEDICKKVSFSPSHISHCFKAVTSQTLIGYINFVRCENAQHLLKTGDYSVQDCANMCGFSTLSYFSRIYKLLMGVPPSNDIKQH